MLTAAIPGRYARLDFISDIEEGLNPETLDRISQSEGDRLRIQHLSRIPHRKVSIMCNNKHGLPQTSRTALSR